MCYKACGYGCHIETTSEMAGRRKMQMLYFFLHLIWNDLLMGMKEETVKFESVFLDLWDEEAEVEAIRNMQDGHWLAVEMNEGFRLQ